LSRLPARRRLTQTRLGVVTTPARCVHRMVGAPPRVSPPST